MVMVEKVGVRSRHVGEGEEAATGVLVVVVSERLLV
jgi:hypothetical protein